MPTAVLERAQAEMLDWQGLGTSVMEISHRSTDYIEMAQKPRQIYASSWVSAMSTRCAVFARRCNATIFSNSAKSDEWRRGGLS